MSEKVKFGAGDLTVISILWSYELVSHWLQSLCIYTISVLFPHTKVWLEYFQLNQTLKIFSTCAATLIVGLMVEAYGHKYAVSLAGLCLALSTPFIAVFTCITKIAAAAVVMFWASSAIFVVSPATYSLVFNQNLDPVRSHVRSLVSIFECMDSLFGKYFIFLCLPDDSAGVTSHEQYLIIVVWVIVTPVLLTLITFVDRMKKTVTGDFINERGMKKIFDGIRRDIKIQPPRRKGRSMTEVIMFVLLLLPALSLTVLDAALSSANSDDSTNSQSPTLKHILFSVQVMMIPLTELVLSLPSAFKETTAEMMILGISHVVNIIVISLLLFRMDHNPASRSEVGTVLQGERNEVRASDGLGVPRPGPGSLSFFVLTSLAVELKGKPSGVIPPRKFNRETVYIRKLNLPDIGTSISWQLTSSLLPIRSNPSRTAQLKITLYEERLYTILITGNVTHIKCSVALGMERVAHKPRPQILLFNSFAEEVIKGAPVLLSDQQFRINSTENFFDNLYPLPKVSTFDVVEVPVGPVQVSYFYRGKDASLINILQNRNVTRNTEPYGIYIAYLLHNRGIALYFRELFAIPPRPTPEEPDVFQQSSYALLGATAGVATVGYTHFFWVESPLRMRAVLYAIYRASIVLVAWLTERLVGESLARSEAIGLLSLQVFTTLWHLGLSWIFRRMFQSDYTP